MSKCNTGPSTYYIYVITLTLCVCENCASLTHHVTFKGRSHKIGGQLRILCGSENQKNGKTAAKRIKNRPRPLNFRKILRHKCVKDEVQMRLNLT